MPSQIKSLLEASWGRAVDAQQRNATATLALAHATADEVRNAAREASVAQARDMRDMALALDAAESLVKQLRGDLKAERAQCRTLAAHAESMDASIAAAAKELGAFRLQSTAMSAELSTSLQLGGALRRQLDESQTGVVGLRDEQLRLTAALAKAEAQVLWTQASTRKPLPAPRSRAEQKAHMPGAAVVQPKSRPRGPRRTLRD